MAISKNKELWKEGNSSTWTQHKIEELWAYATEQLKVHWVPHEIWTCRGKGLLKRNLSNALKNWFGIYPWYGAPEGEHSPNALALSSDDALGLQ